MKRNKEGIWGHGNTLYETITMDSNQYAPAQSHRMHSTKSDHVNCDFTYQCRFINYNKYTTLLRAVDN